MKLRIGALTGTVAFLAAVTVNAIPLAQEGAAATPNPAAPQPAPQKQQSMFRLSEGAASILKLTRGNVTEEVVLAYVNGAGRRFNLTAEDIVALHQEGVSDRVITAALSRPAATAPQVAVAPAQTPVAVAQPTQAPAPTTVYSQVPGVTYVQSPPVYVQSEPTYVYRYPSYAYSYWDPFWYPSVSFRFGYFGGYRGGYHGGYSHGGYRSWGGSHGWSGASWGGHFAGGHGGRRR